MDMKDNTFSKSLFIIGAGGFGREVAWLVERINTAAKSCGKPELWDLKGFLDDNNTLHGNTIDGYEIIGGHEVLENYGADVWCVMAVGNAKVRKKGITRLTQFPHIHFATLIDPSANIGRTVSVGEGCMICAGNNITVDCTIGNHVIINLDCTVGHDAVISDFVTLYPSVNVSGCVNIGKCTEVGTGSAIIQGISIGSGTIIGANSTVIRDIDDEVTAVGSPAKVIKRHADEHIDEHIDEHAYRRVDERNNEPKIETSEPFGGWIKALNTVEHGIYLLSCNLELHRRAA